jgi:hypothetical protein
MRLLLMKRPKAAATPMIAAVTAAALGIVGVGIVVEVVARALQ